MTLLITKAKPNPSGKDRIGRTLTPPLQLAAEWVDIKNVGVVPINMQGVELYHLAYLPLGGSEWKRVVDFSGILPAGQTVRVHSGNQIPINQMHHEDQWGAEHHVFSGQNYVWNNSAKDMPSLWYRTSQQWLDQTEYAQYPVEGKILQRVGKILV